MNPQEPAKRGVGRPAGSDREENVRRILDAALTCFATRGYAGTHFAEVGNMVGFTRSALYQYFPNKQALYTALLEDIQNQHIEAVRAVMGNGAPFPAQLGEILDIFVADHEFDFNRSTFLAATPLEMKRHPELALEGTLGDSVLTLLLEFFRHAVETGEVRKGYTAQDLLLTFLGGLLGMSLFQHSTGLGSVERANHAVMAMLRGDFLARA